MDNGGKYEDGGWHLTLVDLPPGEEPPVPIE
jgi:hypothetical protein